MGVYIHLGGAGNGGDGRDRGVYCPLPEHGRTVHCKSFYNGLVFGGGAEAGTAHIQDMVGAACPGYTGDKIGECSSRGGGGGGTGTE